MTAAAASPTARVEAAGLYERLGVPPSANATEIGRAYRALVRQYTPERSPEEFARIREAYEVLSDLARRQRYDARPAPEVDVIAQAQRAVQAREHATAVRICKQALLMAPDRHDVRALLGFCLLQQGLYDEAIVQLERVMASGVATAAVMARLGDAYRAAKRYAEAEGWYRSAMIAGGDEAAGYCVTLADMLVARGELTRARVVLESCLPHLSAESSLAFKVMARLIDIAVLNGKRKEVARRLADVRLRATRGGTEGEAAVRLGELTWQLIESEHFRAALEVSQTAVTLKPRDPIYDALERLAAVLSKNDLDAAERLLWTHVTFAPRGPLESRRVWVEWYCKALAVCKGLRPAKWAPPLKAVAGCGFKLRARRSDDGPSNSYVATCWLYALGLPLVGLRTYRVRTVAGGRSRLVGYAPAARPAPAPATRKRGGGRWIAWVVGLVVVRTCAALVAGDPAPSAARHRAAVAERDSTRVACPVLASDSSHTTAACRSRVNNAMSAPLPAAVTAR